MGDHRACAVLTPIVEGFPVDGVGINYSDLEIRMISLDENNEIFIARAMI